MVVSNLTRLHAGDPDRIMANSFLGRLFDDTVRRTARESLPADSSYRRERILANRDRIHLMNTLERFHENYTSLIEWTARALKLMIEDDPSEQSAVRNASVEWERKDRAFQAAMGKIKAKEIIMRLRERTEG